MDFSLNTVLPSGACDLTGDYPDMQLFTLLLYKGTAGNEENRLYPFNHFAFKAGNMPE